MRLSPGTRIGSYEIVAPIGAGGMGEVFRARDLKLERDVALKVLPESLADDADRHARFEREARSLAALNHPNIAQIYEMTPGIVSIVMELVEGSSLDEMIRASGGLPLDQALSIAREIADALDAAHRKGIIHRDLKPANVKVTPAGVVKVLDFGLAKALDSDQAGVPGDRALSASLANSPTFTSAGAARAVNGTQLGIILGTAAYMAPEQARGQAVDQRVDVWAFGAVLFEMLTGQPAFTGESVTDVLAAILKSDPDWSRLPAGTPAPIRRLLRRCLERDPRRRLSAMADARLELDENEPSVPVPVPVPAPASTPAKPGGFFRLTAIWPAAAGAIVTAALMFALMPGPGTPPAAEAVVRTSILPPPGGEVYPDSNQVAISPDGTMVAFFAGNFVDRDNVQLWVRRLDSPIATRLEAGDGGQLPFWSPDSTRIGFFAGAKLKTVAAAGGRAEELADAPFGRGGTWGTSGVIVFAGDSSGTLSRVSANGGPATRITTLDKERKEAGHRFPVFLPDGDHFLYAVLPGRDGKFNIVAGALSDPSFVSLVGTMSTAPVYVPSTVAGQRENGFLVYGRVGALVAQPFDPQALKTTGEPVVLADEPTVMMEASMAFTAGHLASASSTGSLAYYAGPVTKTRAVWLDGAGRPTSTLPIKPQYYTGVRVSPDGTQAVFVRSASPTESSLWLIDLVRGTTALLSDGGGRNEAPVWSPDGTRVAFSSDRGGSQDFFIKSLTDASPERPLYQSDVLFKTPSSWSRDGILFYQLLPKAGYDVFSLPATGDAVPALVAGGPNREVGAALSPDGRWMGLLAEDTGRFELYVQSSPLPGRRIQVSSGGATMWWWTPDSRQLVYMTLDMRELWRVSLDLSAGGLRAGTPVRLGPLPAGLLTTSIDAAPDRQRFLALVPDEVGLPSMTIVQHWQAALTKK